MSRLAEVERNRRRRFAAPGGSHDRLVNVLRVALPCAVGALIAVLAVTPLAGNNEFSFVLDKNEVAVANERLRVREALYRGEDDQGRPFSLRAGSALQKTAREPVVQMNDLTARMMLSDGPAALRAGRGAYDLSADAVKVIGPVQFESAGGYDLVTRDVNISLKDRTLASEGAVSGRTNIGTFSGDRMTADLEQRTIRLDGRARLHIDRNAVRSSGK